MRPFEELGPRFKRAWDVPWTLRFLQKDRDRSSVALLKVKIEPSPDPRVIFTNGHFMGDFHYIQRCVPSLDGDVVVAHEEGSFPVNFGKDEIDFERMSSGICQYFTEFSAKSIPIDDTPILVYLTEEDDEITLVAVMRYRLGSSTGLDIPRYVALDPIYHYALRRHAHHFTYNKEWSTIFYYENETSSVPTAFLATMTPRVNDKVQSHLDEMSMFLPEKEG